jgi:hypothetical protein
MPRAVSGHRERVGRGRRQVCCPAAGRRPALNQGPS